MINTKRLIGAGALLLCGLCATHASLAEELMPTPEPEVVVISVVSTPEPTPPAATPPIIPATPEPVINYQEFPWSQDDIDTTAQLYWQMCNTSAEKANVTMLIINRIMDTSGKFPGTTAEDILTQSGEFEISKARCSDRNRNLARANLNRCMSEWVLGNAGVNVPRTALYVDRVNGVLTMYDASWNIVWECE